MSSPLFRILLHLRSGSTRICYSSEAQTGSRTLKIKPTEEISKTKRAGMMKKLHRENKEMFGELWESKTKKVSRQKKLASESEPKEGQLPEETIFIAVEQQNVGPKAHRQNTNQSVIIPRSSLQVEPSVKIAKHGDRDGEKKVTKTTESSWMAKSFAKRIKVLSRISLPSDDSLQSTSLSYMVSTPLNATSSAVRPDADAEMSPKELREIPTVNQLLALNINQCQEIIHCSKVEQIRNLKPFSEDKPRDNLNLLNSNESCAEKPTTSSHDPLSSPSDSDLHPLLRVGHEDMISAGYKLFPMDKPSRQITDDKDLPQILSLPYPSQGEQKNLATRFPSVTRILSATMSAQQAKILKLWEERMIRELGADGFKRYKEELFTNGKLLHQNLQSLLSGKSIEHLQISPSIEGHWKSLQGVLGLIQNTSVLESYVCHPDLRYGGILDCVATYSDKLVLIDWKTSEKPKPFISNTYDTPLQIAAYIGAINYDPNYNGMKVLEGLAVIAYKDGKNCQVFHLNSDSLLKYWKLWLQRLKLYHSRDETLA